jgi:glucose-6-phosphate-specific signal transduction histidine kinase
VQLGIPTQLAPVLFAQALSRLFLVYSAYSVIFAELLIVLAGFHSNNWVVVGAGFLIGFPGLVLWWMMYNPLSTFTSSLYILFLSATLAVASWAVLATMPEVETTMFMPFTLVGFALIMTCGVAATVSGRLLWAFVGYIAANAALFVGALLAAREFLFDWRLLAALAVAVVAIVATPRLLATNTRIQSTLDYSSDFVEREVRTTKVAKKTAAKFHDTLLAQLAVITHSQPGLISAELRRDLERELAHLSRSTVLIDEDLPNSPRNAEALDTVISVISKAESQGLTVHLSGDTCAMESLNPDRLDALSGALAQCLANVLAHSGEKSVEVVILRAGENLSCTVIDGGAGFDVDKVPHDRLGLKLSVRDRIESAGGAVRIWSNTGNGTAVMMQLPCGVA